MEIIFVFTLAILMVVGVFILLFVLILAFNRVFLPHYYRQTMHWLFPKAYKYR